MSKPVHIAAVFLIVLLSGCAYFNTFYNAKVHFRKAQDYTRKRIGEKITSNEITNYDNAISKCLKLLDTYPESRYVDDALLMLGKSYYYKDEHALAVARFKELQEFFPDSRLNDEADLFRARSLLELGRQSSADSTLQALIARVRSKDILARSNFILGDALIVHKNYEGAIEYYQKAVETGLKENRAAALFNIAAAYDTLGNNRAAADYFLKVEDAEPTWEMLFESKFRYGITLRKLGEIEPAIRLFQRLLADPENQKRFASIKLEIALCNLAADEISQAVLTYQDIIQSHAGTPESAEAYYRLAHIYESELNEYTKAVACYQQVPQESRNSPYADSAAVKKVDIQRKMGLEQVIEMADRGEEGSIDLTAIQAVSDSLSKALIAEMDSTSQDKAGSGQAGTVDPVAAGRDDPRAAAPGDPPRAAAPRTAGGQLQNAESELNIFHSEEKDKNLFLLAELNLLRFSSRERALALYERILEEFPRSPYYIRSLYNAGYILDTSGPDTETADNGYFMRLIREFPDSQYAERARTALGLPRQDSGREKIGDRFVRAESLLLDENRPQAAYDAFAALYEDAAASVYGPQLLYVMAHIQETYFGSPEKARALYDSLSVRYPDTEYALHSKKKLSAELPAEAEAVPDSAAVSAAPEAAVADSAVRAADTAAVQPDSAGTVPDPRTERFVREPAAERQLPVGGLISIMEHLVFPPHIDEEEIPASAAAVFQVRSDGSVADAALTDPPENPEIAQSIVRAMKKMKFTPASRSLEEPNTIELILPLKQVILR